MSVWQESAACRTVDPELFYLEDNARCENKDNKVAAAKAVCAGCPVVADCLAFALADKHALNFGVWGGTTPEERLVILRRVRRTR